MNSLYVAATGMINQQLNVDLISNNLSNINTPGYKKSEVNFKDLYSQEINLGQDRTIFIGMGAKVDGISKIHTQGVLQQSENPLDLAIEGPGFFQVLLPDGSTGYTRDGSFRIDGAGNIVTVEGYLLQPPVNMGEEFSEISVASNGIISVVPFGSDESVELGQIMLAGFINPSGLENISGNIYVETESSGQPLPAGQLKLGDIRQGYKEMSNINVIEEMVNLISAQRAYEINSKAIKAIDDMMGVTNNMR
jgi:flagellar basal-body rod protein FlgG